MVIVSSCRFRLKLPITRAADKHGTVVPECHGPPEVVPAGNIEQPHGDPFDGQTMPILCWISAGDRPSSRKARNPVA